MEQHNQTVPKEIKGWNWGAFIFHIYWGIGNKTYLPLLTLIPIFGIFWIFVVGIKGNEWAWRDGHYTDVAAFKELQATWNRAGIVCLLVTIFVMTIISLMFGAAITALYSALTQFGG